jgi:hypothetical protein
MLAMSMEEYNPKSLYQVNTNLITNNSNMAMEEYNPKIYNDEEESDGFYIFTVVYNYLVCCSCCK